jgi:catechol 2,3-dioxygenase
MSATMQTTNTGSLFFRPRRLGHANIFVGDYQRAQEFYHSVVGIEEVYRQPDNRASFISNGNTYHDFGLTDIKSRYAPPGQVPGLFHIALEVETEVDLVEGYRRAMDAGAKFHMTQNHDVAHSLYMHDPDGNMLEIYADVEVDWRAARSGVIVKKKPEWIPGVSTVPVAEPRYPKDPELRIVADSVFRARKVTHIALVANDFEKMFDYYTGYVGLTPFAGGHGRAFAVLGGTVSNCAITLYRSGPGLARGLHHIGIEVGNENDLDRALKALAGRDIVVEREVDHPARRAVCIRDPDGLRLQFFVNRKWDAATLAAVSADDALYLL